MRRLSLLLVIALLTTACGKKGALIYPDMLVPAAPTAVTVRQVGPSMKLVFTLPGVDKAGQNLTDLTGVKVLRHESVPGQELDCSTCATDFQIFKTMYVDHMDSSARRYGRLIVFFDSDVRIGREYAYKVLSFTKDNVDGEASKPVLEVLVQAPLPPVLQALSAPTEIKLEFVGLPPLEGALVGFNLYRSVKGEELPFVALNNAPLTGNSYIDTGLERGVTYVYAARVVVRTSKGDLVESVLSNEAEAALRDDE